MALAFQISDGVIPTRFNLQVTNSSITHQREPKVSALPGGNPLMIDLGQRKVDIILEGFCSEKATNQLDGAINIADRDDIEIIGRDWGDTETVTLTDLRPVANHIYTVKIVSTNVSKREAQESYQFSIRLTGFVSTMDPG